MKYKRILLKLSGESLEGKLGYGIDPAMLQQYATDIKEIYDMGVQIGIVIGGGNIFRGLSGSKAGLDRVQGDYMGMLATIINSMAIQSALENAGMNTKLFSALRTDPVAELPSRRKTIEHLNKNHVVILAGGTGNPYFTTDTASALRAIEIKADAIFKGTRVDGVYSADPEKDKNAIRYEKVSFKECIEKKLHVMDLTAFTLCEENNMPIVVFDMNARGNLKKIVAGENVGTLVNI
jgi:uridylate kinase